MLRVECESCKAPYQVDERRIPATGLKMRCPKCGHTFVVKAGSGEPVPPPDPHARPTPGSPAPQPSPAAANARKMQATMLGVGSGISKPPPATAKAPTKDAAATPTDSEVGLPAAKPVAAKPPVPAAKPPVPGAKPPVPGPRPFTGTIVSAAPAPQAGSGEESNLPAVPPKSEPALPVVAKRAPSDPNLPSLPRKNEPPSDSNLPAIRDAAGLPAAKPAAPKPPAPKPPVPNKPAAPPVAKPAAPVAPAAASFGEIDLPIAAAGRGKLTPPIGTPIDLPSVAVRDDGPIGATAKAAAAPAKAPAAAFDDFGEIDLPALGGGANLPAVAANLPSVAASLPTVADALPTVAEALPTVAEALPSVQSALPVTANVLPTAANVLPAAQGASPIPAPIDLGFVDPFASLPPAGPAPSAPSPAPAAVVPVADVPPDFADFGELDLPPAAAAAPRAADASVAFGEPSSPLAGIGVPPLDIASLPPPVEAGPDIPDIAPPGGGGLAFGEVDLGVQETSGSLETEEPIPVAPQPEPRATEEAIPSAATVVRKPRTAEPAKGSRGRKVAFAAVLLILVGGGALEVTPFGAFGRLAISDMVNASSYERRADEVVAAARKKMASDLFPDARAAADQAAAARSEMPRARVLTAAAALIELETQLRFGQAADRIPRVKNWIADLVQQGDPNIKLLPVAQAAQEALLGDPAKARKALDAASKRDVGDPVQEDVALLRGELELAQKDAPAALAAFTKASAVSKSARAEFGKARALVLARDVDGAKKALEETLKLSPKHVGARIERATIAWDAKDEQGALADITAVLDGDAKAVASDQAKAQAQALRGWIHVGRGRAADARAAFDGALKLDARNVSALVGQGEVLFSEGRYTEALTRFDTAVQTDGASVLAIVSDVKAKLSLERLKDAKTQIAAARAKYPKDWRVAFWLGKSELALGNKEAAEKELLAAVELVAVRDSDAVQPFVALATLYGGQGKTKEAEAKIAEAKAKLPDTASMRRALGELAAARGDFDGAVADFRNAIEKDPADLSTRFRLGVTLRRMRKIDQASAEFDKILAADKDYPGLALERGLLYEESGDIDKALEQFQTALAKAPDDADLQLRVGASYAVIGRPGDAIPKLRKVLEKRPQSAEANHFLGRALFLQGGAQQSEAMRYLKRAVELDPNRAEYHLYVGWAANNAVPVQLAVARDEIEKALAIDKLLADAYWQRGVLLSKQGAYDDAITDLKHALELKPTRTDAHATLGWCYEKKNDPTTAIAEYQKAVAVDATKPDWRFGLGKLLYNKNAMGEALKHLVFAAEEGAKLDPKPGWLAESEFLSAELLKKSGKKPEAIEHYRRFLELAPANSPDRKDANAALAELGSGPRPR